MLIDSERFSQPGDLALAEALKAVKLMRGEGARLALRGMLLRGLRGLLPNPTTPAEDGRLIANQLREPRGDDFHSTVLTAIQQLSSRQAIPTALHIAEALRGHV